MLKPGSKAAAMHMPENYLQEKQSGKCTKAGCQIKDSWSAFSMWLY
jgi:hypothetical protein